MLNKTIPSLALILGLAACEEPVSTGAPAGAALAVENSDPDGVLSQSLLTSTNRKFIESLDICLDSFPMTSTARGRYRTSNYNYEGRFGGADYFSAFNDRIIAFASTGTTDPVCGSGRNNLRDQEAVLLVNAILASKYGTNLLVADTSNNPEIIAAWAVPVDDDLTIGIAVSRQINLAGFYRGSPVYVGALPPLQEVTSRAAWAPHMQISE